MTYIDRLNHFNRWLESNDLPISAQLLYFKLLNAFNRAGWPGSLRVDTLRLMMMTGCQRDASYRAREKLVDAGFITYKKGSKGKPTQYILSDKTTINATERATENATVSATVSATQNATLKERPKTKKKKKNIPPYPPGGKSYDISELEKLSTLRLPEKL